MKPLNRTIIIIISFLCFSVQSVLSQSSKTKFNIEIKNSIGDPQQEAFIKISGRSETYRPDSCGIIKFEYEVPKSYKRTANIYLNNNKEKPVKSFTLDEDNNELSFIIDTKDNLLEFKKDNNTFVIEGIVYDEEGAPIEGAVVCIQGTGRYARTDEIGLFSIEADYNHNIIIRADGMENMSLNITPFLSNNKEAYSIKMKSKGENKIYTSVEKKPQYPGGMRYFKRYIDMNLKYPEQAKKDSIEGVVVMQFVVEKNGDITNPKVARKLEPSLDSIAMQLITHMPKWIPGSDHGITVRCRYSVPISFRIPVPKPVTPQKDSIIADSTIFQKDSITADSICNDTINMDKSIKDSLAKDSIIIANDSIANDSITATTDINNIKVKKRNIFVRFFRWLFGIKDKDEEIIKSETEEKIIPDTAIKEADNNE